MAKKVVNPAAELVPRARDFEPTPEQLAVLGVFASLKKPLSFDKYRGSCILRHYRPGEVMCRQGDAGGTAYYLLTGGDIDALAKLLESDTAGDTNPEFRARLNRVHSQQPATGEGASKQPRRLATARLLVDSQQAPAARRSWWAPWQGSRTAASSDGPAPATIANDGPTEIDYQTRQAAILEGEVFGEMSCLTRQPRSATIVADTECFAVEILRNIFDQMRKDPGYKAASQKVYRQRVLEGHLRQLSVFRLLTDEQFKSVQQRVELVEYAPGAVIWEEGDASDSMLVVRSGIVQVVQSYPWRLTMEKVTDWPKLLDALRTRQASDAAIGKLWKSLPKEVQEAVTAAADAPTAELKQQVLEVLDTVAKDEAFLTAKETKAVLSHPTFVRETERFAGGPKDWNGLQTRRANRVLFHVLLPEAIAPPEPEGLARVLRYVGRGSTLGELGLVLNRPRSATCMAYSHPDADREATDIELVRVPADVVREIQAQSPAVRAEIQKIADAYTASDVAAPAVALTEVTRSRRAEELGLLQGQKLMLIDLDRCTRCGDCVQACINTHDDGHSRLFLDGNRFGRYLIPATCRNCRDPVCMIGCPVGSIQQGDNNQIVIRDWCIGCGLCADQCPYDSIQMQDAAVIRSGAPGWYWRAASGSDDAAANGKSRGGAEWNVGATPFVWGIAMRLAAGGAAPERIIFRYPFEVAAEQRPDGAAYQLTVTSVGTRLSVYLNGAQLTLTQEPPQKKRSEFSADVPGSSLKTGENVVTVSLEPPAEFNAKLLDVRLDRLAEETEEFEEKLVTQRAVVCDQCSTLPGNRAACVYACPHDAAFRVDTWVDFPEA